LTGDPVPLELEPSKVESDLKIWYLIFASRKATYICTRMPITWKVLRRVGEPNSLSLLENPHDPFSHYPFRVFSNAVLSSRTPRLVFKVFIFSLILVVFTELRSALTARGRVEDMKYIRMLYWESGSGTPGSASISN
jgi:hypothetical protein